MNWKRIYETDITYIFGIYKDIYHLPIWYKSLRKRDNSIIWAKDRVPWGQNLITH